MIPQHIDGVFPEKFLTGDMYRSPDIQAGVVSRMLPSLSFYSRLFFGPVALPPGRARAVRRRRVGLRQHLDNGYHGEHGLPR